ncbi:hypothetical protein NDU88_004598 [Pleurodeles waltl]|uniref:Uncharacterized protein n=1 Tax=Pleurodeles waltl TaxID=8319 RepID=A0AAV7MAI4_PLEWA|nr:hypothetical protein NDU88_004598 [Pleurodeles waltl]
MTPCSLIANAASKRLEEKVDPEQTTLEWQTTCRKHHRKTAHRPEYAQMAREQAKAVEEVALLGANLFAMLDYCNCSDNSSVTSNPEESSSTMNRGAEITPRLADDLL